MFGLLLFGLVLLIGISLLSRPVWRRRRFYRFGPRYGRGWGWGAPMIIEERREFEHHHRHDGWGGGHHHHHHGGGWGGGHHGH